MSLPMINGIPWLGGLTLIQRGLFFDGNLAAPSISFFNDQDTGFFLNGSGQVALSSNGSFVFNAYYSGGGVIQGFGGSYLSLGAAGYISLVASGTNQNVNFLPSGTGTTIFVGNTGGYAARTQTSDYAQGTTGSSCVFSFSGVTGNLFSKIQPYYGGGVTPTCLVLNLDGGAVLFGTVTDSGNGKIQLATHTTLGGGIGFGTETAFYRSAAGVINFYSTGATTKLFLENSSGVAGDVQVSGTSIYLSSLLAGGALILRSGPGTTALTLDSSQNATFAGSITLGASTSSITGAAGNMTITSGTGPSRTLILRTTTSGSTATQALLLDGTQSAILTNKLTQGANAVPAGEGAVTTRTKMIKLVSSIADNTATAVLTVTIPNAAHSGSLLVRLQGSLGAGGAIGANEATGTVAYLIAFSRTTGVNAVAGISAAFGAASCNVAGGTTIAVTAAMSAVSGAVGASNSFTVNVTIARGGGASTNHTCRVLAEIMNANATGITIA